MANTVMFNVRIVFTGICSLVTDRPVGSPSSELHLLLPDAWDKRRKTSYKGMDDDEELARHGAFIQIPIRNLAGLSPVSGGMVIWYPMRHRIKFEFVGGGALDTNGLANVADMHMIASRFPNVGRNVLGNNPPQEILANASFSKGTLTAEPGKYRATFHDSLKEPGQVEVDNMSYRILLDVNDVTGLVITASPFDQLGTPRPGNPGSKEPANLTVVGVDAGETVEIVIANACDVNPLSWPAEDAEPTEVDIDFKWHYEILSERRADVQRELGANPLPFPTLIGLGNGRNCFPAFWVI